MSNYPYETLVTPESVGMDGRRLADLARRFERQQAAGAFPGGQMVVRRAGRPVLNVAVGLARGVRPTEPGPPAAVEPDTPFPVLSAGKPLAAVAIAMLEARGRLDVHAPLCEVFPEFAANGKQDITTLDVLTHTSGILMPNFVDRVHLWSDRQAVRQALIDAVPTYRRGTFAYGPWEFGWILSEVVQLVDGRSLADFCAKEIAAPLGLPALRYGLAGRALESLAYCYWLGRPRLMVAGKDVAGPFEEQNSAPFFESQNPAVSMVSDAASLAAFYAFIVGGGKTPDGRQLISDATLRQYTARHHRSLDRSQGLVLAEGRGFMVGTRGPSPFGWWNATGSFGHGGGYCCMAYGDYRTGLSVAIVTNGNRSAFDLARRFLPLVEKLRAACR